MVADGFRWLGKIGRWEIEKWPQEDQFGKQQGRGGASGDSFKQTDLGKDSQNKGYLFPWERLDRQESYV